MTRSGDRIEMSLRERDVLKVMSLVLTGQRTQPEAGELLGLSVRQIRRIQRRLEAEGDAGVVHRLRGRPSNHRIDTAIRDLALALYREAYSDFGPTLASEKLANRGVTVCDETLRRWLIEEDVHTARRTRAKHRRRRERRRCFGELVQADGSPHDWLEGRGPLMTLLVAIDDATSRTVARFYPAETTVGYMDLLMRYLRRHGRMVALYTDRHSIFWEEDADGQLVKTQVTRALSELGIGWIAAHSPQAKGRVERFNKTAQDRLVKELRLAGARTIEEANAVLEKTYLPWFTRRCTVKAASPNDAHRPVYPSLNLASVLSVQQRRHVANDYTIRYCRETIQLLPPPRPGLRGGKVIVEERLDGTRHIRFKGKYVRWQAVAPPPSPSEAPGAPLGAPPPGPRSLALSGMPAGKGKGKGKGEGKGEGHAAAARPPAVHPVPGRSGRTPAEPYPPRDSREGSRKARRRPAPNHPWRNYAINTPPSQPDISTLAK